MSEREELSGPQFRADRPEAEAVRTTIVGGRPPGSGTAVGDVPRGIEALVIKASIDREFKTLLLERRAAAAESIGLGLSASERAMLEAVPREQLEAIIAGTSTPPEHRRAFMGQAAAAMLAALATGAPVEAARELPAPTGSAPDLPKPPAKKPTVEDRVFDLAAKRFDVERKTLHRATSFERDLKAQQPTMLLFREDLEREFKVRLPDKAFRKFATLGQAIAAIEKATAKPVKPVKPEWPGPSKGIRPDEPPGAVRGIRPDDPGSLRPQ